jgi:hypothetical protein
MEVAPNQQNTYFYKKYGNEKHELDTPFCERIILAVKWCEFINYRMLYIILSISRYSSLAD